MKTPSIPLNESTRLRALRDLNILDTPPEADLDYITELASFICGTPISLITLVDENRQWFKSKIGVDVCETPRETSFCAHAILNPDELMEVSDARKDLRFIDNPLTKTDIPVVFYAGVPILTDEGLPLGSLCVIDHKPRELSENQRTALKKLGKQVERLFALRLINKTLRETQDHLRKHNDLLKDFAGTVSHDLKMPLANVILTSDILKKKYESVLDESGINYLKYLKKSSLSMSEYITNILAHYESTAYEKADAHHFPLNDMLENLVDMLDIRHDCEVHLPETNFDLYCNRSALEQIFLNLIGNSLKYNDKEQAVITINANALSDCYEFEITDNGRGIEEEKMESIFTLFSTIGHLDRNGDRGHGIGLSTVQKLVDSLGGTIEVSSELGISTTFRFSVMRTNCELSKPKNAAL